MALSRYSQKVSRFFSTRFFIRDDVLWRVMGIVFQRKKLIITANVSLVLSQALAAIGLVALIPIFDYAINPPRDTHVEERILERDEGVGTGMAVFPEAGNREGADDDAGHGTPATATSSS